MPTIYTTGPVTITDVPSYTGSVPPQLVGDAPQWSDDSDDSYAELETAEHPDVAFADRGQAALLNRPVITNPALATVTARVRYMSLNEDMAQPHVDVLSSGLLLQNRELLGFPGATEPTWAEIPLIPLEPSSMQSFLNSMNGGGALSVRVHAPLLSVYSFRFPRTRVYEVQLVVSGVSESASCQNYPADTSNSVGGGVTQYPESKAWVRSNRFGGGYG